VNDDIVPASTSTITPIPIPRLLLFVAVFALMTGLWLALAHRLVHHPALGAPIRLIRVPPIA
jgi:hypothetical protein